MQWLQQRSDLRPDAAAVALRLEGEAPAEAVEVAEAAAGAAAEALQRIDDWQPQGAAQNWRARQQFDAR